MQEYFLYYTQVVILFTFFVIKKIRKRFFNSNNNINFPYCIGAKVALPDHIKLIKYIKCIKRMRMR